MTESKATLRKSMMKKLATLREDERQEISKKLAHHLFETKLWKEAETIGIYLSFGNEWDTRAVIEEAWRAGKKVVIPKTIPAIKGMEFYQINNYSEVKKGHFDIQEPIVEQTTQRDKNEIDLLVVPGLIFSKNGYRIGFGGGYYDRFLTDFIHPTISLVWSEQLIDDLPTNQYDLPVQYILTEKGIID